MGAENGIPAEMIPDPPKGPELETIGGNVHIPFMGNKANGLSFNSQREHSSLVDRNAALEKRIAEFKAENKRLCDLFPEAIRYGWAMRNSRMIDTADLDRNENEWILKNVVRANGLVEG